MDNLFYSEAFVKRMAQDIDDLKLRLAALEKAHKKVKSKLEYYERQERKRQFHRKNKLQR
nr:hypothetical protein 1 [Desulfobacterales bacterium]